MKIVMASAELAFPVSKEEMMSNGWAFPIDVAKIMRNIELAGRTCYKSEDKMTSESSEGFVRRLIASGHESVLEHEKISVRVVCDRGVSHEIVRHRLVSYSQESTRYCDYKGEVEVIAIGDHMTDEQYAVWREAMQEAEKAYAKLRSLGVKPQIARSVLPNSLKTELVMTANLREWRTIFKQRTSRAAHPQMREVMIPLLDMFVGMLPAVFGDIKGDA